MSLSIRTRIAFVVFLFFLSFIVGLKLVTELVKGDFIKYVEGEKEDEVYILTSFLESQYERYGGFNDDICREVALLALSMGYEIYLFDQNNKLLINTKEAIKNALPLTRRRHATHIKQFEAFSKDVKEEPFLTYDLFLRDEEIGTLYLRHFEKKRTLLFLERSNQFFIMGLFFALVMSFFVGTFITSTILNPISKLYKAVSTLAAGKRPEPLEIKRKDELGELAKAFNTMSQSLYEREKVRKTQMAKFAHELRTPLAIIQAELEGMIDDVLPLNKERLKSLNDEVIRLKKIIEGLESLYRIEKFAQHLKPVEVELCSFFRGLAERFELKAREKNTKIVINCEPIRIKIDLDLFTHLIYNLLDNALNATENGIVTIVAKEVEKGFLVEVRDTGKGIPKEDLPYIFERFYSKSQEGLGIGLAIVKEVAEILNAVISVTSEEGKGTVFSLFFRDLLPSKNS